MLAPSRMACASPRSLRSTASAAARRACQISLRPSKAGAVSQNSSLLVIWSYTEIAQRKPDLTYLRWEYGVRWKELSSMSVSRIRILLRTAIRLLNSFTVNMSKRKSEITTTEYFRSKKVPSRPLSFQLLVGWDLSARSTIRGLRNWCPLKERKNILMS